MADVVSIPQFLNKNVSVLQQDHHVSVDVVAQVADILQLVVLNVRLGLDLDV